MSLVTHGTLLAGQRVVLPTDFPNLRVWVDANTLSTLVADGVGVQTWAGLAGTTGFAQATEANRPLFRLTGGNGGRPCVEFDGLAFFMATGAIAAFDNSNLVSAVIVMQELAFVAANRVLSTGYAGGLTSASDTWGFLMGSATAPSGYHRRAAGSTDQATGVITATTWHAYAVSVENVVGGISFYRDGVTKHAGPAQTPGSPTTHVTTRLGAQTNSAGFSNVRVAEVAMYSQTMSQGNLARLLRSLCRKWGCA